MKSWQFEFFCKFNFLLVFSMCASLFVFTDSLLTDSIFTVQPFGKNGSSYLKISLRPRQRRWKSRGRARDANLHQATPPEANQKRVSIIHDIGVDNFVKVNKYTAIKAMNSLRCCPDIVEAIPVESGMDKIYLDLWTRLLVKFQDKNFSPPPPKRFSIAIANKQTV